jgi:hypothetical protein
MKGSLTFARLTKYRSDQDVLEGIKVLFAESTEITCSSMVELLPFGSLNSGTVAGD